MTTTRTTVWISLPGILALLLVLCSCKPAAPANETSSTTTDTNAGAAVTGEQMKTCFQCNGSGKMTCPDCQGRGEVDCPGHCLKRTKGTWIHMDVAGYPATDVWQEFEKLDGRRKVFNQDHVGHIIALSNGEWVDTGPCPICHGTGKVPCPRCKGTGEVACDVCDGKKVVPESWTAFDNPKMKNHPIHFTMKDGRTLFGKKVFVAGNHTTIHTTSGDVEVNTADIVSESKPDAK